MPARPRSKHKQRRRRLEAVARVEVLGSRGNVHEVSVLENGKARCSCKGFRFRGACRHLLDPDVRDLVLAHAPQRHGRQEVAVLASMLVAALAPCCARVEVMGSLRRGREDVKDIDLIFLPGGWPAGQVLALFRSFGRPVHQGEGMAAIVLPQGVPAQLWPVERPEVWGAAQLHYTGPRDYNISLRVRANRRGWKLSQHGLVDRASGRLIAGATEEQVLRALDLPWLPPALREQHARVRAVGATRRGRRRSGGGL